MRWIRPTRWMRNRFVVAAGVIAVAAMLRVWPLATMGTRVTWLTFYPAVMVAASYGGFVVGVLSALLACGVVLWAWPLLSVEPFIRDSVDQLGMAVFVFNGMLISAMAEAMRRAQARAVLAQRHAEDASRAKSVFLASMSHELRTPMNAILGFSGLLKADASLSPAHRESVAIINRSGAHLLSLINDVLDMAKIEAGRVSVEEVPVDLPELLLSTTDLMRVRAEEKNLELALVLAPDTPRWVRADGDRLRQVLLNLIGNAVKYTMHGRVVVRVSVRPGGDAARPRLVAEVEDTGIGIAAEDQARVFEPFVQVGRASPQHGTGLGLAIARQLAERMGGTLRLASTPGHGSVFRLDIPVGIVDASDATAVASAPEPTPTLAPGQPEHRILIVEDEPANWQLLRRLLDDMGFRQIRVAENGADGLHLVGSWRPAFVWMDLRLPDMDGLEVTRQIRAMDEGSAAKIVALSASVFNEERDRVLAAGMDGFIRKPYHVQELCDCLADQLGVRFIHAQAPEETVHSTTAPLREDAVAALAPPVRGELAAAVVALDSARLTRAIHRVAADDPLLAEALARHAASLDYTAIWRAVEPEQEAQRT